MVRRGRPSTRGGFRLSAAADAIRRCIVTGESDSPAGMLRFVVAPDGAVVPDVAERLPGRGMWVSAERDLLERAVAKGLFARAAKRSVHVPDDLAAHAEAGVARRVAELLGLLRRSGALVTGFDAVRAFVRDKGAAAVITAADAAANAHAKGAGFARTQPHVTWLSVGELSLAVGGENVVHAAIAPGSLTERFLREARRLRGLRGLSQRTDAGATVSNSGSANRVLDGTLSSRATGLS